MDWWEWIDENALAWKFGSIYPGFPVKIKENPRDEGVGLIEFLMHCVKITLTWKFGSIYPGFPVKTKEDEGVGLIEFLMREVGSLLGSIYPGRAK